MIDRTNLEESESVKDFMDECLQITVGYIPKNDLISVGLVPQVLTSQNSLEMTDPVRFTEQ